MTRVRKGIVATGLVLVGLQVLSNSLTDIVLGLAIVGLIMAEQKLGELFK